jgi:hypothetical protein
MGRRAPVDEVEWVIEEFRTRYSDFATKAKRRGAHRRNCERRPLRGMLVFQDASSHRWLSDAPPLDLVVTMDDATGRMLSISLVEQDGTASSLRGLSETVKAARPVLVLLHGPG